MLRSSINKNLDELIGLLQQLSSIEYSKPSSFLSGSSIGEHIRHIVELFQCLGKQYKSGVINYDQRPRNLLMQTNIDLAIQEIISIKNDLKKENKNLVLQQKIEGYDFRTETTYHRELLYNLEHCIHHQALIKVAVLQLANITIDDNFGFASSTIEYRKQCVQ